MSAEISIHRMSESEPTLPDNVVPLAEREEREERRWLPRHLDGDGEAFRLLVEAYRRPVFNYLVRSGVASTQRDDLFQEIFLKVHRAARRYDPCRPLKPWLFTIVLNTVRNHFRDRKDTAPLDDDLGRLLPSSAPGPARTAAARERTRHLEEAVAELPEPHREALLLCCIEGLSRKAAARALDLPVNTVKTHLRRARLALARRLAELDEGEETP